MTKIATHNFGLYGNEAFVSLMIPFWTYPVLSANLIPGFFILPVKLEEHKLAKRLSPASPFGWYDKTIGIRQWSDTLCTGDIPAMESQFTPTLHPVWPHIKRMYNL